MKKSDLRPGMVVVSLSTSRYTTIGSTNAVYVIVSTDEHASQHGYGNDYRTPTFVKGAKPNLSRDKKGILAIELPAIYITESDAADFDENQFEPISIKATEISDKGEHEQKVGKHKLAIIQPNAATMTLSDFVDATRRDYLSRSEGVRIRNEREQKHRDLLAEVGDLLTSLGGSNLNMRTDGSIPTRLVIDGDNSKIVLEALRAAVVEKDSTTRP